MALMHYQPFGGLLSHRDEMNRLFGDAYGRSRTGQGLALYPPVDVTEDEDRYTITVELPGLSTEDVKITLERDVLTIEGEKREERERGNYHRLERTHGRFRRSFALPRGVRADQVKGAARDGVLTITVPKAEEARVKEIAVETA